MIRTGEKGTDKPLYDAEIQSRASVRIEPGECFATDPIYAAVNENGQISVTLRLPE